MAGLKAPMTAPQRHEELATLRHGEFRPLSNGSAQKRRLRSFGAS